MRLEGVWRNNSSDRETRKGSNPNLETSLIHWERITMPRQIEWEEQGKNPRKLGWQRKRRKHPSPKRPLQSLWF